jgi:hypothetical protein
MNETSTVKKRFLAEIEQIRRLQRRYWLTTISTPFVAIACIIAAAFLHSMFLFLIVTPVVLLRVYSIKLGLAKCPRCGEFYNGDPRNPFGQKSLRFGWGLLGTGSRCVNCDFRV